MQTVPLGLTAPSVVSPKQTLNGFRRTLHAGLERYWRTSGRTFFRFHRRGTVTIASCFTLYRNASGGECPLVIDSCWVCTVVDEDKSIEGLIDTGRDSHGMSLVVCYTFILFLGTLTFGLGVVAWFSRQITEPKAQDALTLGLFVLCLCGSYLAWNTKGGKH